MSLKITMEEAGAMKIVMVADIGFYSMKNVEYLENMNIFFIIPLKRNSRLIDYSFETERYFMFQNRPVFYSRHESDGRTLFTFRNDFLRAEEEKNYLSRHEKCSETTFWRIRMSMGTTSIITNLKV